MIKQGIIKEESVDSHSLKANGSCPLMPEEVPSFKVPIVYFGNYFLFWFREKVVYLNYLET